MRWFWRYVESQPDSVRAKLLHFATSLSRLPVQGFSALVSASGYAFTIVRDSQSDRRDADDDDFRERAAWRPARRRQARLLSANTCFCELVLPEFGAYEELAAAFARVLSEAGDGFGML